jgi:hypothetical protein
MNRITKLLIKEKEILCVDYSDLKEDQMIALNHKVLELVLADNKSVLILNIFNERNFLSPTVMRHQRELLQRGIHLIEKVAILGLDPIKRIILTGINLLMRKDFKAFENRDQAIDYLIR